MRHTIYAAVAAFLLLVSFAHAQEQALLPQEQVLLPVVGGTVPAPNGWRDYCSEYLPVCKTKPMKPVEVTLTPKAWDELKRVNDWVNAHIKPVTDQEHWGIVDRWNYAEDGKGDCEDYVLLKRRKLLEAGWPRSAILVTFVRQEDDRGHALLTVKTDRGEFLLDNQVVPILPWDKSNYRLVMRQSQEDPNRWVKLSMPQSLQTTAAK